MNSNIAAILYVSLTICLISLNIGLFYANSVYSGILKKCLQPRARWGSKGIANVHHIIDMRQQNSAISLKAVFDRNRLFSVSADTEIRQK